MGQLNVEHWSIGMDRVLKFRADADDDRFYDIGFRRHAAPIPIGEVRALYAWLGEPVTDDFESGMRAWWAANAENHEPGAHADPASFGLDLDRVRPLFADYVARVQTWTTHAT